MFCRESLTFWLYPGFIYLFQHPLPHTSSSSQVSLVTKSAWLRWIDLQSQALDNACCNKWWEHHLCLLPIFPRVNNVCIRSPLHIPEDHICYILSSSCLLTTAETTDIQSAPNPPSVHVTGVYWAGGICLRDLQSELARVSRCPVKWAKRKSGIRVGDWRERGDISFWEGAKWSLLS